MDPFAKERELAVRLAREAGAIALKHRCPDIAFEEKPDDLGPVTAADKEADAHIREALRRAFPKDGLLTEETPDDGRWRNHVRVWMVDPLDGTKEFVRGHGEFSAMIGLAVDGEPVVGAVYQPVGDLLYAASRGGGAQMHRGADVGMLQVGTEVPKVLEMAVSRSHRSNKLDLFFAAMRPLREVVSGSVGLKVGLIAAGKASAYLSASRCSLWDTCGPDAILRESGGVMTDLWGAPVDYRNGVEHTRGLFCGTGAVHARWLPTVAEMATLVCPEIGRA
jgi:3'(2'), 5'-bisphosphate nucleotidase